MRSKTSIDRAGRLNAERREIILDAARLVFDAKGLRGASLRAIAKAADCTTGAIYPYFKGKEEIYAELLGRSLAALHRHVLPPDSEPAPARERFMRFIGFYVENPADFALGLYLYDQGAPIGVGKALNTHLNTLLLQAVRLVAYGDPDRQGDTTDEAVLLATLMGLIVTHATGRVKLLDTDVTAMSAAAFEALSRGGFAFK